jgi:hypothetical protein
MSVRISDGYVSPSEIDIDDKWIVAVLVAAIKSLPQTTVSRIKKHIKSGGDFLHGGEALTEDVVKGIPSLELLAAGGRIPLKSKSAWDRTEEKAAVLNALWDKMDAAAGHDLSAAVVYRSNKHLPLILKQLNKRQSKKQGATEKFLTNLFPA